MTSTGEILVPTDVFAESNSGIYMEPAIPQFSDFLHMKYKKFCLDFSSDFAFHRKIWEFAFITEMFDQASMLQLGYRGLGFGVGREPLPSYFARRGCNIVATDEPVNANDQDWSATGQHASVLAELHLPAIITSEDFNARVSFQPSDMNAIPDELSGFDFCWSACALDHLGSIDHGIEFIHKA